MNKKIRRYLKNAKWLERLKKLFYSGRRHYNSTVKNDIDKQVLNNMLDFNQSISVSKEKPIAVATTFENFKNSKIGNKLKETNTPYTEEKKKEVKTQVKRSNRRKVKQELKQVVTKDTDVDNIEEQVKTPVKKTTSKKSNAKKSTNSKTQTKSKKK